jgi:hypothetical protein
LFRDDPVGFQVIYEGYGIAKTQIVNIGIHYRQGPIKKLVCRYSREAVVPILESAQADGVFIDQAAIDQANSLPAEADSLFAEHCLATAFTLMKHSQIDLKIEYEGYSAEKHPFVRLLMIDLREGSAAPLLCVYSKRHLEPVLEAAQLDGRPLDDAAITHANDMAYFILSCSKGTSCR